MKLLGSLIAIAAAKELVRGNPDWIDDRYVDAVCADKGPGSYTYSDTVCNYYIVCSGGGVQPIVLSCSNGLLFNESNNSCDYEENVPPSCGLKPDGNPEDTACLENGNGFYPNENDCNKYFICYNGGVIPGECPDGFAFDQSGMICTNDEFVTSLHCTPEKKVYGNPVTTTAIAFCKDKEDGYYGNPGFCASFIKCWQNMGSEFMCPTGLVWNSSLQMCDHPELIKDGLCMREFNEGSLEFNAIDICELHGKTGLFPTMESCSHYVQCYATENGLTGNIKICPDKLVFNDVAQVCDWPENVLGPCHNGKQPFDPLMINLPSMDEESNEIAQDATSFCKDKDFETYRNPADCSSFYTCQLGRADMFHCPAGTVYWEKRSACEWAYNLPKTDACYAVNFYGLYRNIA